MTIPASMRAVVCHGPGDYRLAELPTPAPGPGEILLRVEACGICAGDAKCSAGAPMFWGDGRRPAYVETPVIPGHEFAGVVAALGEGAGALHGVDLGDRVVSEQIVPCRECRFCLRGQYWMCRRNTIYGFKQMAQGGMADYMILPAQSITHSIPDGVSARQAAVIEPLACAMHAVQRSEVEVGDMLVIAGAGPLGLLMVAAARLRSPGLLVAVDVNEDRLAMARRVGADLTLNPAREDAVERVLELSDGYGCDRYIEATGHPEGVEQGLQMIRRLGTFVEFSVFGQPTTVDWTTVGDGKELDIHGSHLGPWCYGPAIDCVLRGRIDVEPVISHVLPLERFAEGFSLVANGRDSIKVLLEP